ncbi:unnamed protein product [Nyctereutes procyonoides]|uniref:(raccoon dog) hypothetical protein n=1 Tax=Nyctereutes procyonoides TaxID=34880 RepID=A0A811XZM2_NYCPR|nr:unnamed protein product [Nyctereutes procyonoides]
MGPPPTPPGGGFTGSLAWSLCSAVIPRPEAPFLNLTQVPPSPNPSLSGL